MFNQDKCSGSRRYHKACHKCRSCGKLLAPGKAHLHNKEPYCRLVWGKHLHFGAHWLMRKHVPIFIASEKNKHNWAQTNVAGPAMHQLPSNEHNWTNWTNVAGPAMHQLPSPPHLSSSLTRPPSSTCALWTFWIFGTNGNVFSILNIFNMRTFGTFRIFWTSRAPWTSWPFGNSVESWCGHLF